MRRYTTARDVQCTSLVNVMCMLTEIGAPSKNNQLLAFPLHTAGFSHNLQLLPVKCTCVYCAMVHCIANCGFPENAVGAKSLVRRSGNIAPFVRGKRCNFEIPLVE